MESERNKTMITKKSKFGYDLYFPEDKKKKVYAVDAYVTMSRCFKVEASSAEEAERIVDEMLRKGQNVPEENTAEAVEELGLSFAEEWEEHTSGEADKKGEICYY